MLPGNGAMIWRLVLFLLMLPTLSSAQELKELGYSIRSMGMGGMYVPVASGVGAVFHNPAALGRGTGLTIELMDLKLGVNGQEAIDLYNTGTSINNPSDYNKFFGKKIWFETQGHAGVTLPSMGIGFMSNTQVSMELHNPGYPQFQTYFLNDQIIGLGGAFSLGNKSYLGVTFKQIRRWGGETIDLGLTTIANANNLSSVGDNFKNKGTGYGIDLALMKVLDAPSSPSLSLVLRDVGNTQINKTDGVAAPPSITQNLVFGAGGMLDLPGLDFTYGMEVRHLLDSEVQLGKKVHLGTEVSLPFVDLRAGVGQGYMSYGVGMNFFFFRFDVASYTEELGVYPGQTGQNRYVAGLTIDLSFDANFSFVDSTGHKRKLKQRR